ncbi:DoxX family protein [Actinomadura barringtoniae]|uniref:DoxX family protein n=1 Tax=Actinomadura barringtoniae TaxID=1427535 RepID=A0A939P7U8_9ACTN|nr:DoxX family protein [Actinomadura barringtoniae]MBO2447238.1 DoxX family protein [Actinomadura barringtoniae]
MTATHAAPARTTATDAPAATERKTLNRVVWGVQIFLALFFIVASGLPKFVDQKDAVESFVKIGWGQWFQYFTGACEVAGGIGLLVRRLSGAAALGLIGVMIGATIANLTVLVPASAVLTVALGVIFAGIAWYRREETKALVRGIARR